MQNNSQVHKLPSSYTLTLTNTSEHPPFSIVFYINTDDEGAFVDKAKATLTNRKQSNLKEYSMNDICASIFYNEDKQVAALHFSSRDLKEDEDIDDLPKNNEFLNTLKTLKDEEAIAVYNATASYWIGLDLFFQVREGNLLLVKPIEEEDADI